MAGLAHKPTRTRSVVEDACALATDEETLHPSLKLTVVRMVGYPPQISTKQPQGGVSVTMLGVLLFTSGGFSFSGETFLSTEGVFLCTSGGPPPHFHAAHGFEGGGGVCWASVILSSDITVF